MRSRTLPIAVLLLAALIGLLASLDVLIWASRAGDLREALATSRLVMAAAALGVLCALLLLAALVRWFRVSWVPWSLLAIAIHVLVPVYCYRLYRASTSMPAHLAILAFGTITLGPWLWLDIALLRDWRTERRERGATKPGPVPGSARPVPSSPPPGETPVQAGPAGENAMRSRPEAPVLPRDVPPTSGDVAPADDRARARRQLRWEGEESRAERRQRDYAHAKARQSAQRLLLRDDWLVLDTETTGLGEYDEVIGIAVLDSTGAPVFASPLKPVAPIHPDATAIHGRTMGDLAGAPRFPEIWPRLRAVLHGHTLIAYDAKFDRRILELTAQRYGLALPPARWRCAMTLYARFWGEPLLPHGYRPQKLVVACRRLGIPLGSRRAADQCRATLALLRAIAGDEGPAAG